MFPQIFNYDANNIRVVAKDGEPWFVLKDVCEILELDQVAGVKRRLSDDVISNHPIADALGRMQETTIINEDGLYDVILESRKPEAKAFRKWITSEVVPTIRKTGSYSLDQFKIPQNYTEALRLAADLSETNEKLALQTAEQERQLKEQAAPVAFYNLTMAADNTQPIGTVAKTVGMGRNNMFKFLRERKVLMPNSTIPYQRFIDSGYFVVKERPTPMGERIENIAITRVTAKGLDYIAKLVRENQGA